MGSALEYLSVGFGGKVAGLIAGDFRQLAGVGDGIENNPALVVIGIGEELAHIKALGEIVGFDSFRRGAFLGSEFNPVMRDEIAANKLIFRRVPVLDRLQPGLFVALAVIARHFGRMGGNGMGVRMLLLNADDLSFGYFDVHGISFRWRLGLTGINRFGGLDAVRQRGSGG